jgi:Pyridoxamine 5'-phosphate oxidase
VGGLTEELRDCLDAHRVGVLATTTADGKPHQSSTTPETGIGSSSRPCLRGSRRRTLNEPAGLALRPRDEQPYPSATFSGEPQSDEALAEIDRVILAITVERVTAMTHM